MFDLCFKSLTIFLLIILFLRGSRATDWTKNSGLAKILHRPVGSLGFPKSSNMGVSWWSINMFWKIKLFLLFFNNIERFYSLPIIFLINPSPISRLNVWRWVFKKCLDQFSQFYYVKKLKFFVKNYFFRRLFSIFVNISVTFDERLSFHYIIRLLAPFLSTCLLQASTVENKYFSKYSRVIK